MARAQWVVIVPIFSSIFFQLPAFASVNGQLLTTTVGNVGGKAITSREVQISYLVERALYGEKGKQVSIPPLEIKQKEFSSEVNAVLLEQVVYLEAQSFSVQRTSNQELELAEQKVLEVLNKNDQWLKLGVSRSELSQTIERKMRAKRFIQFKAKSSVVQPTDDEAKEYFEKNRVKFGSLPFEKFQDNIKAFLSRQQVDRRLRDWFEVLQEKYKVKNQMGDL